MFLEKLEASFLKAISGIQITMIDKNQRAKYLKEGLCFLKGLFPKHLHCSVFLGLWKFPRSSRCMDYFLFRAIYSIILSNFGSDRVRIESRRTTLSKTDLVQEYWLFCPTAAVLQSHVVSKPLMQHRRIPSISRNEVGFF